MSERKIDSGRLLSDQTKLMALYKKAFPSVARFVASRGGDLEQAKDVFHDAVVVWYEKQLDDKNDSIQSEDAYLFGVAKNIWYRKFSRQASTLPLNEMEPLANDHYEETSQKRLLNLLATSGRKCMDMLKSFYYEKCSMEEIAQTFGFQTVRSATVQKYKCMEKVRETVKQKALQYEDFLE